jgi:hypothetical protein
MNTAESLRDTCLARRNQIYGRRIEHCRQLANNTINNIVNQLFATPNPLITEHHPVLWQESLSRACEEGINYVDIDITRFDDSVSHHGSDSFPYEDKVNIHTGTYVLDKGLFEPMYVQGAPKLLTQIITRLPEGFTVDIRREADRRILRISVNLN